MTYRVQIIFHLCYNENCLASKQTLTLQFWHLTLEQLNKDICLLICGTFPLSITQFHLLFTLIAQ